MDDVFIFFGESECAVAIFLCVCGCGCCSAFIIALAVLKRDLGGSLAARALGCCCSNFALSACVEPALGVVE